MNSVERQIAKSADALRTLVWPAVSEWIGGGDLIPVETVRESDFARILDTLGGVDAWQKTDRWIRGVASRVQFGDRDWSSHTVRYRLPSGNETELHKRLRYNAGRGVVGPHLTLQAYVDDTGPTERLLSVAVARTADLLDALSREHVSDGPCRSTGQGCASSCWPDRSAGGPVYTQTNREDRRGFVVVEWRALAAFYDHFLVRPEGHRLNEPRLPGAAS